MQIKSLRIRSLITIVAVVLPLMVLYTALSYSHVSFQLGQRFDGRMRGELRILQTAVERSGGDVARLKEIVDLVPVDTFPQRRVFGVWYDGKLVLATEAHPFDIQPMVMDGFTDIEVEGDQYRILAKTIPAPVGGRSVLLAVADREPTRSAVIRSTLLDVIIPLIIGAPLVVFGIYVALVKSLSPLTRLAEQIRTRSAHQLEPIATDNVPTEALPIANSVNQLLGRVGESLERERRFTADAAHELKTPLTALKTHAQVALRTSDEAVREGSIRDIVRIVNRTDRLIAQLLTLARLDPDADHAHTESVDLANVASSALSELKAAAEARDQTLQLHIDRPAIVRGSADALGILVRNIVENAVQYAEGSTAIDVRVMQREAFGVVEVVDRGPGIPIDERQSVFRRFRRIAGTKSPGTGLGLSIVQRIAEIHHAQVTLHDGESGVGLRVVVSIPLAA